MLQLNSDQDKSRVAANKIFWTHRHLDMMKPLFNMELDLLPLVITWLEHFAESHLDLKLSSLFEFVRAMPMNVIKRVAGKKRGGSADATVCDPIAITVALRDSIVGYLRSEDCFSRC